MIEYHVRHIEDNDEVNVYPYTTLSDLLSDGWESHIMVEIHNPADEVMPVRVTTIGELDTQVMRNPVAYYLRGANKGWWYQRTNPVTGEVRPHGPFAIEQHALDSIADDEAQTVHAMSPLNSDRIRRLRDQAKLLRTNADRAAELADKAEVELAQAIAAAMIEAEQ